MNGAFDADLARLGTPESLRGLRVGIEGALGVPAGEALSPAEFPLLGYYFTFSPELFLAYFVTPGRFVRYEVFGGQAMTVAVPIGRVTRVVETAGAADLVVTVELDADAVTGVFESRTEADGTGRSGRAMTRLTRTGYEMAAKDPEEVARLAAFSRALRSSMGV